MAKVSIVIVNYNGAKFQNDCLKTIHSMDYTDYQVIIVDSGSTDNSIQMTIAEYPDTKVVLCNDNIGVAKGNNIGIDESIKTGSEFTLLMNNDIEADAGLLSELMRYANENTITVPKIYYYDPHDVLWFGGGELDWAKGSAKHWGIHEKDKPEYNQRKDITYSPTCCMLIHNEVFSRVGKFDEDLFMYYDDTDFCARVFEAKINIHYVPTAFMWHKVGSSSGGGTSKVNVYYMFRNQLYYINKHKKKLKPGTCAYVHLRACAKLLLSPIQEHNNKYIKDAYLDYYRGRMGRKEYT